MRRAYKNDWLTTTDDRFIGINCGADYCAEHEWGIKGLRKILGVEDDENVLGVERRRIKKPNLNCIVFAHENKNNAFLLIDDEWQMKNYAGKDLDKFHEISWTNSDDELLTAWSEDDLCIRVHRPVNIKKLKRIHEAILNKDAAIWLGGGQVFQNAGLCIALISQIPDECKKAMYDGDLDRKNLKEASAKIGIKERIEEINANYFKENPASYRPPLGFYALSPTWAFKDAKTKYNVMYWLNPQDQENNDYGWMTVEDLEDWIKGEGRIPKKKQRA